MTWVEGLTSDGLSEILSRGTTRLTSSECSSSSTTGREPTRHHLGKWWPRHSGGWMSTHWLRKSSPNMSEVCVVLCENITKGTKYH